ncbi:MAG: hypothetical protein NVSMB13_05720 [Mycobacteriales bacterium]
MNLLATLGNSLSEGFFMFWETLWALVLGFTLSGAVQSFVSRDEMHKALGDHRPRTIVRTSPLGAASSSCSYAASALAKSLFQRGADFTSAMVFMFASTNLVIELGIVLWLLIGWQFALAEFVGGAIMIVLFVLLAPRIFPAAELAAARQRLDTTAAGGAAGHEGHGDAGSAAAQAGRPFRERLASKAGWADAASYTVSDLTMLRRELFIGYLVAGILAVAVPEAAYSAVFASGHGILTDIENVVVGPFIAFISFVCSIGNVPLAAALYKGGISFGGTVAFIFADLIALPLVVIYGKFYGRRLALRLFFSFWAVMSTAGLAVDLLFRAVGIKFPARPVEIAPTRFEWNYTTFLNIVFLLVAAAVYLTYRKRDRLGGGQGYAKDPVCGMQVERDNAPASARHKGTTYYFCSDRCAERFGKSPDRYAEGTAPEPMPAPSGEDLEADQALDPVCGMTVQVAEPGAEAVVGDRRYVFCGQGCAAAFTADPGRYGQAQPRTASGSVGAP